MTSRTTLAALLAAATLLAGCSGDDPGREPRTSDTSDTSGTSGTPRSTPSAQEQGSPRPQVDPVLAPTDEGAPSCANGREPRMVVLDSAGHRRFTGLLTAWADRTGRPHVDRDRKRISFLREDGSTHTALTWMGPREPRAGRRWFPSTVELCPDAGAWRDLAASGTPVELAVGHCWIDPVEVGTETWDVIEQDQFGWGGLGPEDFAGEGELAVIGDVALYTDASGHRLTLVPQGDPWALEREFCA